MHVIVANTSDALGGCLTIAGVEESAAETTTSRPGNQKKTSYVATVVAERELVEAPYARSAAQRSADGRVYDVLQYS